jgi:hypothetical protein
MSYTTLAPIQPPMSILNDSWTILTLILLRKYTLLHLLLLLLRLPRHLIHLPSRLLQFFCRYLQRPNRPVDVTDCLLRRNTNAD